VHDKQNFISELYLSARLGWLNQQTVGFSQIEQAFAAFELFGFNRRVRQQLLLYPVTFFMHEALGLMQGQPGRDSQFDLTVTDAQRQGLAALAAYDLDLNAIAMDAFHRVIVRKRKIFRQFFAKIAGFKLAAKPCQQPPLFPQPDVCPLPR
jgi:hypothetical protein